MKSPDTWANNGAPDMNGDSPAIRLQKHLASCGVGSRRACERLIEAGRVLVNGQPASLGQKIDPETDNIVVDESAVTANRKYYVVLNKPKGVVTSAHDTHARRTVVDCVHGVPARVYPVGRLDMDVSGTLLLTNDGELTHRLCHPSFSVDKVYVAWVHGVMSPRVAEQLEQGVELDDGPARAVRAAILRVDTGSTRLRIVLHEGRNRLVKRMCAKVGHPVRSLSRQAFGFIRAEGLRPGEWRYLTDDEVARLFRTTGLDPEPAAPAKSA